MNNEKKKQYNELKENFDEMYKGLTYLNKAKESFTKAKALNVEVVDDIDKLIYHIMTIFVNSNSRDTRNIKVGKLINDSKSCNLEDIIFYKEIKSNSSKSDTDGNCDMAKFKTEVKKYINNNYSNIYNKEISPAFVYYLNTLYSLINPLNSIPSLESYINSIYNIYPEDTKPIRDKFNKIFSFKTKEDTSKSDNDDKEKMAKFKDELMKWYTDSDRVSSSNRLFNANLDTLINIVQYYSISIKDTRDRINRLYILYPKEIQSIRDMFDIIFSKKE